MDNEKSEIRKMILQKRKLLQAKEMKEYSEIICSRLKENTAFSRANIVFAYVDTKNEVSTSKLLQDSINQGKTVCLPLSIEDSMELKFYRVFDLDKDLKKGNYGIFEPVPNPERLVLQEKAELIIVPGVAFDLSLNRIGYGKGYYDSFLAKAPESMLKIALAYDFQLLESIPTGDNDIKMDMIITEKRIITHPYPNDPKD